jgi:uncharacterized protein YukE
MSDEVFAVPDELVEASLTFIKQANAIRTNVSSLDHIATSNHTTLTTKTQNGFNDLWFTWNKKLLDLAHTVEGLGILLEKTAVTFIEQDSNISQAFKKNPQEAETLNKKIQAIQEQVNSFESATSK